MRGGFTGRAVPDLVVAEPTVATGVDRMAGPGVADCWLTAGLLFQDVGNGLTGRAPGS